MTYKANAAAAVTTVAIFAVFGASAETLRVATVVSAPHPWIDAAEMFKEEVEANTDFTVEIFPGGQLGNDATVVDEMRIGTVDVMIGGVQNIAPFVREFEFFSLNYLFGNMDVFRAATEPDSEIFTFYTQQVADADVGLKLLALTGGGTRNLSTSSGPVTHPDDLDGVRMRVTGSSLDARTWGAVGAVTTSLPWTELYTGVQTGVVSAFESTISGYVGSRLYEVAPYHAKTEHQIMMSHISMATLRYDRLSDADRTAIETAALNAARHGTDMGVQYDGELIEQLGERGVTVTEVDKDAFIEAAAPLHEEYAETLGLTNLLETVRSMH
ncbi:TRAP transporter substrate-binding protein [Pararhodobacter sp. SW119]|uniref:TRAP transporter substrate-binding protein n=1 Tax=Pararhodobacter sp. SW119 TaxID=2780075 RepID=UPI001AE0134E|nr:TRAP transporter substrate-binding protein [Pararhodobacter sp. SW119]